MKLVIAEKPSVARDIANILGAVRAQNGFLQGNGYIVSWCFGHLIELYNPDDYDATLKKWSMETLPIIPDPFKYKVSEETKEQFYILKELMGRNDVESVVCATDAGREGEAIFRLVYSQAQCDKPIERLWISSMEDSAIREGFRKLQPGNKYLDLYDAALGRQKADWLVGLNGTRYLSCLYNAGRVLKVGRVQSPTLNMIVMRENEINNFVKKPYYKLHLISDGLDSTSEAIESKEEAINLIENLAGHTGKVIKAEKEQKSLNPPKLYDLTSLQRDANKIFCMSAKKTLECTQSLYEKKLATYPRTDACFLTDDMSETARTMVSVVAQVFPSFGPVKEINTDRVLNSKKVTDHHAIIPTINIRNADINGLSEGEKAVLYLISSRLLMATSSAQKYMSTKIEVDVEGTVFTQTGKEIISNGWKDHEAAFNAFIKAKEEAKETDEKVIPALMQGQSINNCQFDLSEHFTKPPAHFTEDTLLAAMEKAGNMEMDSDVERKGLGTPATRADIIEKLINDGFIVREDKKLLPTADGYNLIKILPDSVKSVQLTCDWENKLSMVAKGQYLLADFLSEIISFVKNMVSDRKKVEGAQFRSATPQAEKIGKCPKCGGDIVTGKYGAYCENKCGMSVSYAMGKLLDEEQIKDLLSGKKILLTGIKNTKKPGSTYSAYLTPVGVKAFSYTKQDGTPVSGFQFDFKIDFPKKRSHK